MNRKLRILVGLTLLLLVSVALTSLFTSGRIDVLEPAGSVAGQQRDLIYISVLLMLIVVVPVFIMVFLFAWRYREGNKKAKYHPDWDHNKKLEAVWWSVPLIIILILGGIIWKTSHSLDPYQPLNSKTKPEKVQVVALQWRWLFIYPERNLATVNELIIPEDTPINFEITSDAPMNSFWIPRLGGQVYAMAGMNTTLHLIADEQGSYNGYSANISGEGFSDMKFTTKAVSTKQFQNWVNNKSGSRLDSTQYQQLAKPTRSKELIKFSSVESGLFNFIIGKYMNPQFNPHADPLPVEHNKVHDHRQEHSH